MDHINTQKYKDVIVYLAYKLGGTIRGKKKLAKLLYFIDFDMFEYKESMKTVTGDVYNALPMGPVPALYMDIMTQLIDEKIIDKKLSDPIDGYSPTEVYTYLSKAEPVHSFDADEKYIIDRVIKNYGELNGKQLEDLSHGEAPWNGVSMSEVIPFELAFYRDTDFAV